MTMGNQKLGELAQAEINEAMLGLSGSAAKGEAMRLAEVHHVSWQTIYNRTKHLRPKKKERSDKGTRAVRIEEHPDTRYAIYLVTVQHEDPDIAMIHVEAIWRNGDAAMGVEGDPAYCFPITLENFQLQLRELGFSRKQRKKKTRACRRWEAAAPGKLFQIDFSGVKTTMFWDKGSRKLVKLSPLDHSRNHQELKKDWLNVWCAAILDDHSRFMFCKFYAARALNSGHTIDFLLSAFEVMGTPEQLYSDRDGIIIGRRLRKFEEVLNNLLADSGGFQITAHAAGNPQATGKVERLHQKIQKYETLLGSAYDRLDLEGLNRFGLGIAQAINNHKHSETGELPVIRFNSSMSVLRMPPPKILHAAFGADDFYPVVGDDLTISHLGEKFQLPRAVELRWAEMIGKKVKITWLPGMDFFIAVDAAGELQEIDKQLAQPDIAGEWKTLPETTAERLKKELSAEQRVFRKARKEAGSHETVPYLDTDESARANQPGIFPRKRAEIPIERIAALSPELAPPTLVGGRRLTYLAAVDCVLAVTEAVKLMPDEKVWLKALFAEREQIQQSEFDAAWQARTAAPAMSEPEAITAPVRLTLLRSA